MSVLIKGMEMPKVAGRMEAVITILKDGTAQIAISPADDGIGYWKEYPLIFVPPHGGLIDINALKLAIVNVDYVNKHDYLKGVLNAINNAQIVIPADKDCET